MEKDDNKDVVGHGDSVTNSTTLLSRNICLLANRHKEWVIDSGASDHICHDLSFFTGFRNLRAHEHKITILDDKQIEVKCIRTVQLGNEVTLFVVSK